MRTHFFHSLALLHFFPITLAIVRIFSRLRFAFCCSNIATLPPLRFQLLVCVRVRVHEAFVFGFLFSFEAAAAATEKWIQMGKNE